LEFAIEVKSTPRTSAMNYPDNTLLLPRRDCKLIGPTYHG
jgi:hypothetical protein